MNTRPVLIFCATLVSVGTFLTESVHALSNAEEKTPLNDAWLTTKTKVALFTDARVRGREINVESTQGLVILRGKVDSDEVKQVVEGIANGVYGIKSVKNDLEVVPPSKPTAIDDKGETSTLRDHSTPCENRFN
jgi:hypothetical protein